MNTAKLIFTIPTYYTTLAFLEGKTPRQLLEEFVYYERIARCSPFGLRISIRLKLNERSRDERSILQR